MRRPRTLHARSCHLGTNNGRPSDSRPPDAHQTRSSPATRTVHPRREYHCRKNRNEGKGDAVYNNLAYLPVCNCMPVCRKGCRNPTWMWTKKK